MQERKAGSHRQREWDHISLEIVLSPKMELNELTFSASIRVSEGVPRDTFHTPTTEGVIRCATIVSYIAIHILVTGWLENTPMMSLY